MTDSMPWGVPPTPPPTWPALEGSAGSVKSKGPAEVPEEPQPRTVTERVITTFGVEIRQIPAPPAPEGRPVTYEHLPADDVAQHRLARRDSLRAKADQLAALSAQGFADGETPEQGETPEESPKWGPSDGGPRGTLSPPDPIAYAEQQKDWRTASALKAQQLADIKPPHQPY